MEVLTLEVISKKTLKEMGGSLWILDSEGQKCKLCGMLFKRQRTKDCNRHRAMHLVKTKRKPDKPRDPRQCLYCNKFFGTSTMYKQHLLTHPEAKKFRCKVCEERFLDRDELQLHLEISKHNKGSFKLSVHPGGTNPAIVPYADKAPSIHPVSVLHHLVKDKIVYTTNKTIGDDKIVYFNITADIDGKQFTGKDASVKKAKFNLAKDAISTLFDIKSLYELPV